MSIVLSAYKILLALKKTNYLHSRDVLVVLGPLLTERFLFKFLEHVKRRSLEMLKIFGQEHLENFTLLVLSFFRKRSCAVWTQDRSRPSLYR